jgi:site-specific DNA recombinase
MVSTSVNSKQGAKAGTSEFTCVIYARVSTDDQADRDFSSVDAQIAGCRRKAEDNGWIIIREFRDDGASGKNLNRPAMKELIALLKRENVGAVIAVRMDRLSRDAVNTEFLIDLCKGRQTEIVLLQQVLDENTASGRMNRRMNSVLNQYERESTGDRVRFKIEELARNGMRSGGWTPPGYVLGKAHEYSLDDRYAPMIRRIFEQAAAGTRVGEIAAGLKADGYVVPLREINRRDGPKKIGGRPFTWDQVKHLIKNPFYKGVLVVGNASKEFTSNHEAIVSSDLWNRANAAVERNGRPDYKTRQNKHELLLHGLVSCGCCKGPLVAHPGTSAKGKAYLYYRCQNLRKNGRMAECSVGQVPARKLEDTVIDHIGILAQEPAVLDAAMEQALKGRKTQLLPLKGQISSLDEEIRKLNNFVRELRDRLLGLPAGSQFINQIAAEGEKAVVERQELEAQKKRLLENKNV